MSEWRQLCRWQKDIRPTVWRLGVALWSLTVLALALLVAAQHGGGTPAEWRAALAARLTGLQTRGAFAGQTAIGLGPAPDFTLPLFNGSAFRLSGQRGHVVLVNFWASWCVPCRNEAPRLEAAARRYRSRGLLVVGVDTEDTDSAARAFIRRFDITYPTGPDNGLKITQAYGATGLPTTFFVSRAGQIDRRWMGELQQARLKGVIDGVLR